MPKTLHDDRGYSMVELLVATAITAIIISAIYGPLTGAIKIFRDVKSVSDNVLGKSPTISMMERYFDRWGKGVATTGEWAACPDCPESRHYLDIGSADGCDTVEFYGNIYGLGFVLADAEPGNTAALIDCRLSQSGHNDKTYLWRGGQMITPLDTTLGITTTGPECVDPDFAAPANATITAPSGIPLRAGDIIQRAPFLVEFSCYTPSFDSGQTWLRVQRTDTWTNSTLSTHIAPVNSFTATALPAGCDQAAGECRAVEVTLELVSQSTQYDRQTRDTYTVTRTFGR